MVYGVHGNRPVPGFSAQPSFLTGFSHHNVFMVEISYLADNRPAGICYRPELAGWQLQSRFSAFFARNLGKRTGSSRDCPAPSGVELYVMNNGAYWYEFQRHTVSCFYLNLLAADNNV